MQIEKTGASELTITGNIKSIEDSAMIKRQIVALVEKGAREVVLNIVDSFSMTSSVIGYLMKLVHHDKVKLSVNIKDRRLHELLGELNLIAPFNVRTAGL